MALMIYIIFSVLHTGLWFFTTPSTLLEMFPQTFHITEINDRPIFNSPQTHTLYKEFELWLMDFNYMVTFFSQISKDLKSCRYLFFGKYIYTATYNT